MKYDSAPLGSGQARTCAYSIHSKLCDELDHKLILLADENNPALLLNKYVAYYQSLRAETGFIDYITRFRLNVTKAIRYTNLVRAINLEIFSPILIAGIQNNALEQAEKDLEEMEADQLSQEIVAREWALESVRFDLEEQLKKIKNIDRWAKEAAEHILIVEKQDEAFVEVTGRIKTQQASIERGISIISLRQKIYKINRDAVNFIVQKTSKGNLKEILRNLAPVWSLQNINGHFKSTNPSRNSILHALCDHQALTPDKFRAVVENFAQLGQNMNEVNGNGQSILDYAQDKRLGSEYLKIIQENGGLALKNLKSSLKKDTQKGDQPKKTLRISDDTADKKQREKERALTRSMGLL